MCVWQHLASFLRVFLFFFFCAATSSASWWKSLMGWELSSLTLVTQKMKAKLDTAMSVYPELYQTRTVSTETEKLICDHRLSIMLANVTSTSTQHSQLMLWTNAHSVQWLDPGCCGVARSPWRCGQWFPAAKWTWVSLHPFYFLRPDISQKKAGWRISISSKPG